MPTTKLGKRRRPVRIAFCEDRYHSYYGAQQNLINLAANLPVESYAAHLVTTKEGEFAARAREAGVATDIVPMADIATQFGGAVLRYGPKKKAQLAAEFVRYNVAFAQWLRQHEIDAVVVNNVRYALAMALATKGTRTPLIVFLHGEMKMPWLTTLNLGICDRMLLITGVLASEFHPVARRRFDHKLATLNMGFRFESLEAAAMRGRALRERLNLPADACVIGLVGSVSPRKGADLLVRAAPEILKRIPNAYFVLIGHAPPGYEQYDSEVKDSILALGLGERWRMTGFLEDMPAAYGALDISVLPSRSEGLPGVVIESLAYGLPCVATDVGGTREAIVDQRYGRIIPPDDLEALVNQIAAVWQTQQQNPELTGERAATMRSVFTTEAYVGGFCRIVDETLCTSLDRN